MSQPVYDHDLPRSTYDRLGQIADLLAEIRDRLPAPARGGQPVPGDGPQPILIREPEPPSPAEVEPEPTKPAPTKKARRRVNG